MKIAGFKKTSLVDYPGNLSAVIFLAGCNFRCGFCHNPSIVFGKGKKTKENEVMDFLDTRKGILEGVCVTGGEPTIHENLPLLLKKRCQEGNHHQSPVVQSHKNFLKLILNRF